MSRKKSPKAKGGSAAPSSALPAAQQRAAAAAAASSGGPGRGSGAAQEGAANGVALPSRPSLSSSGEFHDVAFKVMLVGDSGVGKTCLLVRFKDGAFLAGSFISTVGIDFRNKVLNVDGVKVKLQIWDTAGQERFRSVTHAYYRDAHALLLLYDVTNRASFDNIQAWLTEIHEYAKQDVVLMLLGNKVDSTQDRVVKREDGEKLAKEYGVPFMETSAKSGLNVDLAFMAIAKELKHRSMKLPNEPRFRLHDYVRKEMF
ncbi:ras-related protein Rab-26 isoform X2 [Ahaetulla prasina]|uniref:ras-related protein Rab-26 isoform X2 n=1 Tax=Ahaetulla prasina TaxID=499056 RepID=UPI0026478533|nr:ras-related protein Rab-26 isoform X2 [Ahaetulla prasina]